MLALAVVGIIVLVLTNRGSSEKTEDDFIPNITLKKRDKIPYGTYAAYQLLQPLFPEANLITAREEPGYWRSLSSDSSHQLLLIVSDQFSPDRYEIKKLLQFADKGNDVFISAMYFSDVAEREFNVAVTSPVSQYFSLEDLAKSIQLRLANPPFTDSDRYKYPGFGFNSYFSGYDKNYATVIGYNEKALPDFLHISTGKGNIYLHLEPLAFSNYFLLHKNNYHYLERMMSLVSSPVHTVAWDEYFINKRDSAPQPKKGWLRVLFSYPALRAALLTAFLALLTYLLLGMRRQQRWIPVIRKPKNDSLDFVKTIGRLYFEKGDHNNLCRKMAAYFLEHVRSKYKLSTSSLDDEFINSLHFKSGVDKEEVKRIVQSIRYLNEQPNPGPAQLTNFYKQLESFYKKA